MREQLVKRVDIVPIEVVVRNVVAGTLSKRLGIAEGTVLPHPLIEFYYKSDALGDPLVTEDHIMVFGWAIPEELDEMVSLTCGSTTFCWGYSTASA
jgi:phosphoribosylaminoimidazole-succinocarboxamide synthase